MGEAALALDHASADDPYGWGLRLAQQAFAALLDDGQQPANFRLAALRASARARLITLSAVDRGRLQCWLALQIATGSASSASKCLDTLSTVDAPMSASVRVDLPAVLSSHGLSSADSKDPIPTRGSAKPRLDRSDKLTQAVCRLPADLLCFRPFFADTGTP